jgi:hypothetical protein
MGLNWLCHRFPKTMSVILFIVNVLFSGRRAPASCSQVSSRISCVTERCRSGPVSVFALSARATTPSRNAISAGPVTACHGRQSSAPCDGGWKLLATAIAPTWSGPAGFSRQYDEIIGVPILQHSPKKGSRDSQFERLFVAWVERPAKFQSRERGSGQLQGRLEC